MSVKIRPTIPEDIPHCIAEKLPYRIKCVTLVVDDKVVGLGGCAFLPDGTVAAFAQILPAARKYPIAVHRAGLRAIAEARRYGVKRMVATPEPGREPAERWLERLGFKPEMVAGNKVFVWEG